LTSASIRLRSAAKVAARSSMIAATLALPSQRWRI